jgi:hypothetical protein
MPTSEATLREALRDQITHHIYNLVAEEGIREVVGGSWEQTFRQRDSEIPPAMLEWLHQAHAPEVPPPAPPPPQLDQLQLDTGYIVFSSGVAVGGTSHLSLFPNGTYSFTGHFHESGATSHDVALVWVLRSASGTVFVFGREGRVHGTFESGSRDFDWGDSGTNPVLAAAWADLSIGYAWQWKASANADFGSLFDAAVKAVSAVGTVASVVKVVVP